MRQERGFTLCEVMVVICMLGVVFAALGTVGATIHREEQRSAAYAADLEGLRRAVTAIEDDLRRATSVDTLTFHVEDGVLRRGDLAIARNIAQFEVTADGALAHVRVGLCPRSDATHRRDATLAFTVRMRNAGETR